MGRWTDRESLCRRGMATVRHERVLVNETTRLVRKLRAQLEVGIVQIIRDGSVPMRTVLIMWIRAIAIVAVETLQLTGRMDSARVV